MKVLVVDDERVARQRLLRMLKECDEVSAVHEARGGKEAVEKIRTVSPDVVLLDIQMLKVDGFSVAVGTAHLKNAPHIIFVTAHDQYAVRAFEASAVDYLLKPVEAGRLKAALAKSARLRSLEGRERLEGMVREFLMQSSPYRVVARRGLSQRIVDARDVSLIKAQGGYSVFHHAGHEFVLDEPIVELERQLGSVGFVLSHRGELINLSRVVALHRDDDATIVEFVDGQRAAVSRRELPRVKERLGIRP